VTGESVDWLDWARAAFGEALPEAMTYARLLTGPGIEWGLIGPAEAERLWERHIGNSLCVAPLVPEGAVVADLGSGAGLPGIPLALARPDVRVELVEPMQRRVDFLDLCVRELGLGDRVCVVRARAEEYTGPATVLTARAVARLDKLVRLVSGLVPPAVLLAIKGERAEAECAGAAPLLSARGLVAEVVRPVVAGRVVGSVVRVGAATENVG